MSTKGHQQRDFPAGGFYQVKLDANPEDFLDWDAPLGQQAEGVAGALKNAGVASSWRGTEGGLPGDLIYHTIARNEAMKRGQTMGTNLGDAAASQALKDAGIPGIRYLDQGSRGAGNGTRNYVVFDPSIIDILNRH